LISTELEVIEKKLIKVISASETKGQENQQSSSVNTGSSGSNEAEQGSSNEFDLT